MSEMLYQEPLGGWEAESHLKILLILWKVEGMDAWWVSGNQKKKSKYNHMKDKGLILDVWMVENSLYCIEIKPLLLTGGDGVCQLLKRK